MFNTKVNSLLCARIGVQDRIIVIYVISHVLHKNYVLTILFLCENVHSLNINTFHVSMALS